MRDHRTLHSAPRDPDVIEDEIDLTRSSIEATLGEIQRRVSARAVMDRALSYTRDAGVDFGSELADTVRHNPVPTVLTGVGIAWLMAASRTNGNGYAAGRYGRADGASAGERAREKAAHARQHLHDGAERLRESAHDGADHVRHTTRRAADRLANAGERLRASGHEARNLLDEQPLLVGAIAVALGATLGALLPATSAEDRYLGPASDRAKARGAHRARDEARDLRERADERRTAATTPAPRATDSAPEAETAPRPAESRAIPPT
jgi:hypothetical protein